MNIPDPLVPPDVDLSGFRFMPLDTVRLLDSDLFALSTGEEFKAAVALWCKSWLQKPAGSLPDDDRVLAHLSGAGQRWKKLRAVAMRGFILCSDGRWYHPLIAEKAIEAWQRREDWQEAHENKQTRQQRWRQRLKEVSARLRDLGVVVPSGASLETMERLLVDAEASTSPSTSPSTGASTSPSTVDASETGKTGTGTGTGILKPTPPTPSADAKGGNGHDLLGERPAKRDRKRKPVTDVPTDFEITDPMYDWANEKGLTDEEVAMETELCLNHHQGKGNVRADWTATWRTWVLNAVKFKRERQQRRAS